MEALLFSLGAVSPIVLMVVIGYILKKLGLISETFAKEANKLVFKLFMPVMLFTKIYAITDLKGMGFEYIIFVLVFLLLIFIISVLTINKITKVNERKGVLIQAIFRSGYSLIGIPVSISLYGEQGGQAAALLSACVIPLFNVLAVICLAMYGDEIEKKKTSIKEILLNIIKNPLIIGIGLAVICIGIRSVFNKFDISFRLSDIEPLFIVLNYIGGLAIPVALLVLGAQFEFSAVKALKKEIIAGTTIRTVIVPLITLCTAYFFFNDIFTAAHFATFVAVFATPVAVPSVPMVQESGGDVVLAGQLVVWSTLVSAFTIFITTFLLSLGGIF